MVVGFINYIDGLPYGQLLSVQAIRNRSSLWYKNSLYHNYRVTSYHLIWRREILWDCWISLLLLFWNSEWGSVYDISMPPYSSRIFFHLLLFFISQSCSRCKCLVTQSSTKYQDSDMCSSLLCGKVLILASLKSVSYTWAAILPDADFTLAIMVSVYIVPYNCHCSNIYCIIHNHFVKFIVISRMAFWVVDMIFFLARSIPTPHILERFKASTFGLCLPFFVPFSSTIGWLILVRRRWLVLLVKFTSILFYQEAAVMVFHRGEFLELWRSSRSISSNHFPVLAIIHPCLTLPIMWYNQCHEMMKDYQINTSLASISCLHTLTTCPRY